MANEKRLIDANALIDDWNEAIKRMVRDSDGKVPIDFGLVICAVSKAPTVDAVEVVHGRWEKAEYNGFLRCDQCKDVYINEEWLEDGKWNYCPNCGAKMDGDGNG